MPTCPRRLILSNPSTILAQLDHFTDQIDGSLVPPLHFGVTTRPADGSTDVAGVYARSGNSAALLVEKIMMRLEDGAVAAAFGSGSAVVQAMLATLRPGDRILFDTGGYYEIGQTLAAFGARWGISIDYADFTDLTAVHAALRSAQTRLVWAECLSNPLWRVPDIAALAAAAHAANAKLVVDATVVSPVLCTPLRFGADYVLHSATKVLNGHGDVLAGVLTGLVEDEDWRAILDARTRQGSALSPFSAWLLLRGMRTAAVRMDRVSKTAMRIAEMLSAHPMVSAVHYSGLPGDPGHQLATRQFSGSYGGMLSFRVRGAAEHAIAVCAALQLFRRATSLGSTESLAEHRLTTEGPGSVCPPELIRLSIGLEDAEDLISDLRAALLQVASTDMA